MSLILTNLIVPLLDTNLHNSPETPFDVVIIGSGISGLTAAALLSKANLRVCVLERHYLIGGYLQGFERKDFIFDTAIHWLNQCNEGGTVHRLFSYLGDDFPRPQVMQTIQRHVNAHHSYALTNNPEELRLQLLADFPHEKKGIERFFKEARKLSKITVQFEHFFRAGETMNWREKIAFRLKQMRVGMQLVKHIVYTGEKGMKKGLGKYFKDEKLQELFCTERDLLSCLLPVAWAYNNDYQNPPIGGSQVFPAWLMTKINAERCQVRLNATVTDIVLENNKFVGVNYTNRTKKYTVLGKYLIAACDTEVLYEKLLPENAVSAKFKANLHKAELYSSSVTVSIALNCTAESLGFGTELILLCAENKLRADHTSGDPHTSSISILAPTTRDKTMAPEQHGTITLYVPAWMEYENNWQATIGKKGEFVRGDEYKAVKDAFAQVILDRVEALVCPNLRKHILFYEVATPITYQRYSNNKNGTMMGSRPGKINMQAKVAHYRTPISNIVVGGHWAELGGGVPIATKAAYNASLLVLKELDKVAFEELVEVMKPKK